MRRRAILLALLAAAPALRAGEARTPFLVFREPDEATRREITGDLISGKALGDSVPAQRRLARERLADIGPWAVPFLADALHGRRREGSARIRMNAALTLVLLNDPRGLDALRGAATGDDDPWVRQASTLGVGTFRVAGDVATLRALLEDPRTNAPRRAAALALAKLRHPDAGAILGAVAAKPPPDAHEAAAVLLAAALSSGEVALVEHLEHRDRIVQQAAAMGLVLRPLPPPRAGEILRALRRTRLAGPARVTAIRALGAISPRTNEVREALLDLACRDGAGEERIAALLELEGRIDDFDALRRAYGRLEGRNDPVVAALLFAMAWTRHPDAFGDLLNVLRGGSGFLRAYAAGSLLHVYAFDPGLDAGTEERLRRALVGLAGDDYLEFLAVLAGRVAARSGADRATAARDGFASRADPRNLRLFDLSREERTWRDLNRLVAAIFELDEVLVAFDSARPGRTPESAIGGEGGGDASGEGRRAPSGTNEEQDLFDLILPPPPPAAPEGRPDYPERPAYFVPEDLARG